MINTLIKELERWVVSYNTCLRGSVEDMDVIALLRNVHPYVRVEFAYKCKDAGLITRDEVHQFLPKPSK
jgi:hypothetical protein